MFTRNEFLFFWLPFVVIGGGVFSMLVVNGTMNTPTAILMFVVLGIALKVVARLVNPPAAKSEGDSHEVHTEQ